MTLPNRLHLTKDRKVSPQGIYQENFRGGRGRWIPTIHNSFGLPAGPSCPGKTPFCKSCYARRSEQAQDVAEAVDHNLRLLLAAGTDDAMAVLLIEMLDRFVAEANRKDIPLRDLIFRIHWDGDFFSLDYASAWAHAIQQFPSIRFWAYTRSFVPPVNVVPVLHGIPNLRLYLSADEWNIDHARAVAAEYPDVLLAICTIDFDTARQLTNGRPSIVCPENSGRMPLMNDKGRGACVDCKLCPDGRKDVLFSTSHQEKVALELPRMLVHAS